jgi:hypothetical protein
MTAPRLACGDERRREAVRRAGDNGLDYLEVSDDQRALTVSFLGKAPDPVGKGNVRIDGPPGAPTIQVDEVLVQRQPDPDEDDCMEVIVAHPGDYSSYTLRLVEQDERGRPTERPLAGFDPRYDHLDFSFKVNCPTGLDCGQERRCPPAEPREPEIDYLAKDYASFRQLILDRLALVMPDWQERHVPDLGIALVEILAYVGDYLSYHQDAVATEAYLATARQRISVRRHARLVDYAVHEGCNARVLVCLQTGTDQSLDLTQVEFLALRGHAPAVATTLVAGGDLPALASAGYEVFEPMPHEGEATVEFRTAHNQISFYTWGDRDCCLPAGATAATLRDEWAVDGRYQGRQQGPGEGGPRRLDLHAGDLLVFEEVLGPRTGNLDDADRSHRHAVRLTSAEPTVDPRCDRPRGQPVVEIQWAVEDALPFPLCLSTIGPPPACEPLTDISVARGNVVLADHGWTVDQEDLGEVEPRETVERCEAEGRLAETTVTPAPFAPTLQRSPLTFSQPLSRWLPAARVLTQDPRSALPQVVLTQSGEAVPPDRGRWTVRPDLLDSGPLDQSFVVEVDNQGRAHLRFGDGRSGSRPAAGTSFHARYRVGNGPSGNVGAEAVSRIVFRGAQGGDLELQPRNPLAAAGGTPAEPVAEVKALAPTAFRTRLERAVTADDYAALAARNDDPGPPRVQRAAATLRWTGGWYEVLTTVDPLGEAQPDEELLRQVAQCLYRYRRAGHDLVVAPAAYVALDVELSICLLPDFLRGHVRAALLDAFSNRTLPGGRKGLFHPDNLTFGQGVAVSRLIATAQAVAGVESVEVKKLERLFEGPNREVQQGFLRLGPTEVARLDNDPNALDRGRLVLRLCGGR